LREAGTKVTSLEDSPINSATAAFSAQLLAFNLASTADTIIKTMVAVLTLIAAALVVVGLGRAWRGRRQAQVVIEDVVPTVGIPSSSTSGLSPQLRQGVRRALLQETLDASFSVLNTLEQDLKSGLLHARGGVRLKTITAGLRSTTEDSLTMLAAGVRAVAPKEAAGLIAALGAALPAQRGWAIRVFPVLRSNGSNTEVGMAIELSDLGHPPDAVTTFWMSSTEWQSATTKEAQEAIMQFLLYRLLDPTALWIATRLVSRQLAQAGVPKRWRLLSRGKLGRELTGLQRQLAGQLSLYATRKQKEFDRGFAEQALSDLADSAQLLQHYFRPHLTKAAVHERLGWSYRHSGEMQNAANEFNLSIQSYDESIRLLEGAIDAIPDEREAALERAKVRRAKCRLLTGDRGQLAVARQELVELCQMAGTASQELYNGACLFAMAVTCSDAPRDLKREYESYAWYLLGRALIAGGANGPWELAMNDDELEAMDRHRRTSFRDELRARHPALTPMEDEKVRSLVKDVMLMIGILPPGEQIGDRSPVHGLMGTVSRLSQSLVSIFGSGTRDFTKLRVTQKRRNT
jgi:hypothetical protein